MSKAKVRPLSDRELKRRLALVREERKQKLRGYKDTQRNNLYLRGI